MTTINLQFNANYKMSANQRNMLSPAKFTWI